MSQWNLDDADQREAMINALVDGELSAEAVARLEAAVAADQELGREVADALALRQLLGGMPRHKAPRGLRADLLAVAKEDRHWFTARWPRMGALAAALVVAILAFQGNQPGCER